MEAEREAPTGNRKKRPYKPPKIGKSMTWETDEEGMKEWAEAGPSTSTANWGETLHIIYYLNVIIYIYVGVRRVWETYGSLGPAGRLRNGDGKQPHSPLSPQGHTYEFRENFGTWNRAGGDMSDFATRVVEKSLIAYSLPEEGIMRRTVKLDVFVMGVGGASWHTGVRIP